MFAEHLDVDHRAVDVTILDLPKQALDAVNNLDPARVAERKDQSKAIIARGALDRFVELTLACGRQIGQPADRLEPNIFFQQLGRFLLQEALEQTHQGKDLRFWALPVLRRK